MFKACNFQKLHQQEIHVVVPGGEILKCDPEIGKTAIQPEPAQTADLSISGSRLISSLCSCSGTWHICHLNFLLNWIPTYSN